MKEEPPSLESGECQVYDNKDIYSLKIIPGTGRYFPNVQRSEPATTATTLWAATAALLRATTATTLWATSTTALRTTTLWAATATLWAATIRRPTRTGLCTAATTPKTPYWPVDLPWYSRRPRACVHRRRFILRWHVRWHAQSCHRCRQQILHRHPEPGLCYCILIPRCKQHYIQQPEPHTKFIYPGCSASCRTKVHSDE